MRRVLRSKLCFGGQFYSDEEISNFVEDLHGQGALDSLDCLHRICQKEDHHLFVYLREAFEKRSETGTLADALAKSPGDEILPGFEQAVKNLRTSTVF